MRRFDQLWRGTSLESLEERLLFIVTANDPSSHVVDPGTGFDGVAKFIRQSQLYPQINVTCTSTLLLNTVYIITAAHCLVTSGQLDVQSSTATFKLPGNIEYQVSGEAYFVEPSFIASYEGRDIALVRIAAPAPVGAESRDIYRDSDEITQVGTKVGYGFSGTGATGDSDENTDLKRQAQNRYDADASVLNGLVIPALSLPSGISLAFDFDNGFAQNDAFAVTVGSNYANLGTGVQNEGSTALGDSGGPMLIDNRVAGITSGGRRSGSPPDVNGLLNSSFGEFGVDTRVSAFASWIDEVTTPPKVAGVTIGSTGAQPDYVVPADGTGAQRKTLPLFNAGAVNEIKVQFSEGVTVQQSHLSVRPVGGSNLAVQSFTAPTAQNNFTGTWVTTAGLGAGFFEIELSNNIVDSHGNRLDGEWTNPTSATQTSGASAWPSGDGTNGTYFGGSTGTFQFQFVIQPGDVDRDNDVDLDDLNTVRNHFGATSPTNLLAAWAFGNMDWSVTDTTVDLDDLNAVRNNFGATWGGGQLRSSGGNGPTIGEEALRAALYELYLTTFENPSEDDSYADFFHWDLLGDEAWWKATLAG